MPLPTGARIGPYEITGALGAGGMGEVYRASDTKLGRDVALKFLPEAFAADPDRLARFEREAKTLAALNHPNIATIYGFEERALVMELVEGPTLEEQIRSNSERRTPTGERLEWAVHVSRQIADGLEAAHELGIIHRDLKPANVKVRPDGTVKILDFGLAKAMSPDVLGAVQDPQNSPTITAHGTKMGMILGTAAYMAPEQAKGKPVDKRADIWAFGVVLYEMITGRRAFDGEDVSTTLAAVLMKDPDWGSLPADVPAALRTLIRRCLERDPRARLRDIGEARVLLSQTDAWGTQPAATPVVSAPRRSVFWIVVAASVVAAAAIGAWASRAWQPVPSEPVRVRMMVSGEATRPGVAPVLSLSPDGKHLAFLALHPVSGVNAIWVQPLGEHNARALSGTEGASGAFWSPDGRQVGFAAGGQLRAIDLAGGLPRAICDLATGFGGASWNPDGTILFAHGNSATSQRLARVNQAGGSVTDLTKPDGTPNESGLAFPVFLPDGRRFLYLAWSPLSEKRAMYAGSLDGGTPTFILNTDASVSYAEPGWLLFLRDNTLFAQRFNADALRLSGEPVRIADSVMSNRLFGRAAVSVSNNGVLAFREGSIVDPISQLTWFSRSGKSLGPIGEARPYNQVRLSPDERRVAVSFPHERAAGSNIWTMELGNQILTQLTFEQLANDPVWSPDSQAVAFEAAPKGRRNLYRQVVGTRGTTLMYESAEDPKWLDDWSRDGKFLLFHLPRPSKLYALPVGEKPATPILLAETTATLENAHFSPDGRWVAYQLNDTGEYEVWVAAFPAFNHRQRVSGKGGGQAFFRGDGKELFFLTPAGKMMSAAVIPPAKPGGPLELRAPVELFQGPIARPLLGIDQYSVTGDGQRFLFLAPRQDPSSSVSPITVLVNWTTGLGR